LGAKKNYSCFSQVGYGQLYIHGYDENGTQADTNGFIYAENEKIQVQAGPVDPGTALTGYILVELASYLPLACIYDYLSDEFVIKDALHGRHDTIVNPNDYLVIGTIERDNTLVVHASVYERAQVLDHARRDILRDVIFRHASITQAEFDAVMAATGTNFFNRLGAYEAFIGSLLVKKLLAQDVQNDFEVRINKDDGIKLIYQGQVLFHAAVTGKVISRNSEIIGTLRTGEGVTDKARVAIQDETGVTDLSFSGSGPNDIQIVKSGTVAGDFAVEISGKEPVLYDATSPVHIANYRTWRYVRANAANRRVAVDDYAGKAAYSDDGVTWNEVEIAEYADLTHLFVDDQDRFVVADDGFWEIFYSSDGINWYKAVDHRDEIPYGVNPGWCGVAQSPSGRYVAVGGNETFAYADSITNWSSVQYINGQESEENFYGIAVNSSGRFVAVGTIISYSDNGTSWTRAVNDCYLTDICVNSSGRFVATHRYANRVGYSDNGVNWSFYDLGEVSGSIIVTDDDVFIIINGSGNVRTSTDGINWTEAVNFLPGEMGSGLGFDTNGTVYFLYNEYILQNSEHDLFRWKETSGSWSSSQLIVIGNTYALGSYGIEIAFGSPKGHATGDTWTFSQGEMYGLSIEDANGYEYLKASSRTLRLNGTELHTDTLREVVKNGYPGIMHPDGSDSNYIRTPSNGIIPYDSGGKSYCGTSGWPFIQVHGQKVYGAVGNDFADWIEAPPGWKYGYAHVVDSQYYGIPTDTASFTAGKTAEGKMPRAVAGFVLVYTDKAYPIGTKLTYRTDGVLTKKRWWMVRRPAVAEFYQKIDAETWNDTPVNGRNIVRVL